MDSLPTRALNVEAQNALAAHFASLHRPGSPLFLANVYDGATARAVAAHPRAYAVATASYVIAEAHGVADDDLTYQQNMESIAVIAAVVQRSGKPFTVDLQDGYEDVAMSIREIIRLGALGCNIEDVDARARPQDNLRDVEDVAERIRLTKQAAYDMGVSGFVIIAGTDALLLGRSFDEAIERGRRYLAAGATTVFVWGGPKRGVNADEVRQLVNAFDGMLNVQMNLREGFLGARSLQGMGVCKSQRWSRALSQSHERLRRFGAWEPVNSSLKHV